MYKNEIQYSSLQVSALSKSIGNSSCFLDVFVLIGYDFDFVLTAGWSSGLRSRL
jgi:hypothetical protein